MFETSSSEPAALAAESARRALIFPAASLGVLLFYLAVVPLLAAIFGTVPRILFEAIRLTLAIGGAGGAWAFFHHLRSRPSGLEVRAREVLWLALTAGVVGIALRSLVAMSLPSF